MGDCNDSLQSCDTNNATCLIYFNHTHSLIYIIRHPAFLGCNTRPHSRPQPTVSPSAGCRSVSFKEACLLSFFPSSSNIMPQTHNMKHNTFFFFFVISSTKLPRSITKGHSHQKHPSPREFEFLQQRLKFPSEPGTCNHF